MNKQNRLSRRRILERTLLGTSLLGLRSLASGIPISVLKNPRSAPTTPELEAACIAKNPQYVILNSLGSGDPVNANAPGMYDDPAVSHPLDPTMAPAQMTIGGVQHTAATPWTQMPQWVIDRTCFFHHGTYTVAEDYTGKLSCNCQGFLSKGRCSHAVAVTLLPKKERHRQSRLA